MSAVFTRQHPYCRNVLKHSVAALGGTFAVLLIVANSVRVANEKLDLACFGYDDQGWQDLVSRSHGNNSVALCDFDSSVWICAMSQFPGAVFYQDFLRMFEQMADQIDAIGVGTPAHTHFSIAYMAMNLGKHVFIQQPFFHTWWRARTFQNRAAEKGLVTQMGNQGTRLCKEWHRAGLTGQVQEMKRMHHPPWAGHPCMVGESTRHGNRPRWPCSTHDMSAPSTTSTASFH